MTGAHGPVGERPGSEPQGERSVGRLVQRKDDQRKSFGAFSSDAGRSSRRGSAWTTRGHSVAWMWSCCPDGFAVAAYMEFADQRGPVPRAPHPDGSESATVSISGMAEDRGSGYPRIVLSGDELVFAWTHRGTNSQVPRSIGGR